MEGARERIARLARSFDEQDAGLIGGDPLGFEGYAEQLDRARAESRLPEACLWGWADIDGAPCALVVLDFSFLGGSMGVAVGEKIARAFDDARRRRLPVVTVCASGGARMQEGIVALVQMAKTAQARSAHARAGLAHISLLTSPTTGGVYASFASLADVILAEPQATIGFAGPRVVEELTGTTPSPEVHTAEFAVAHGLVDALVPATEQPAVIGRALRNLSAAPLVSASRPLTGRGTAPGGSGAPTAWQRLALARHHERPRARFVMDGLLDDAVELRGDRLGSDDPAVVVRLGALRDGGRRVLALGQDPSVVGRITSAGFRKAIRSLRLAHRLGLPVVTLIDTRGADPLPASEGTGLAAAIAETFVSMLECSAPTLAVVIGEGGSGGALAMAPADRVLCWENAVFSVIAPEGAASILFRDPSLAPELAERLRITAGDLIELGLADEIVPEPGGGAHNDPGAAVEALVKRITEAVERLASTRTSSRTRRRHRRWRGAGNRYIQQAPG